MIRTSAQPKDHFEGRWKKGKKYTLYAVVVNNGTKFRSVTPKEKDEPYVIYNSETETFSANAGWEIVEMSEDSRLSAMGGNGGGGHVTAESIRTALGFTPIGESAISNLADEEDFESFEQNGTTKMRLKDRAYSVQQPNGLGYKILRKDASFASQVTDTNTIYEIRYPFDLNNATVNVPEGSVLIFNGGKLSNGTLNGDDFRVVADMVKIFDGITFTGNCIKNIYELDWFVGNKNSFCDLTSAKKDSTVEVQAAFNSGVMNIHISNQYFYYISQTLVVKSWVAIVGEKITFTYYREAEQGEPCFYTDKAITIMEMVGDSDTNLKIQKEIIIDNVHFRHYGPIANWDYHTDTPVLYIHNGTGVNPQVWGVNINAFIFFSDKNIAEIGKYMNGYTGIEIYADNGYFTYIEINGSITQLRRAVYLHKGSMQNWMTDVRLGFDSVCVWGGQIDASPVRITGSHQPVVQLTKSEVDENPAYFNVPNCVSTGIIWDIGTTQVVNDITYYNVVNAFKTTNSEIFDFVNNSRPIIPDDSVLPPGNILFRWKTEQLWKLIPPTSNVLEKIFNGIVGWTLSDNTASGQVYGPNAPERGALESLRAFNSQDQYVDLTEDDFSNYSKLFNLGGFLGPRPQLEYTESDTVMMKGDIVSSGYTKIEACFVFKRGFSMSMIQSFCYFVCRVDYSQQTLKQCYVKIEFCDDSDNILETKTVYLNPTSDIYYSGLFLREIDNLESETQYTKVRLRFRDDRPKTAGSTSIAKFGILSLVPLDNSISSSGGEVTGPLVVRNVKFDLRNANNGCRHEHNKFINKIFTIGPNAYTKVLNVQPYLMRPVMVSYVKDSGETGAIGITSTGIVCSDKNFSCKLEVHNNTYHGRYLLSIKSAVSCKIYISSVFSEYSMKFIDVSESHESGYFESTYSTNILPSSGTTAQRPLIADIPVGFTYFDTDLGKMIVSNGTAFVNMDGTPLA